MARSRGYGAINPGVAEPHPLFWLGLPVGRQGDDWKRGRAPGARHLTFGANASLTLGTGGTMQFSIMNATAAGIGAAGTDYSAIKRSNSDRDRNSRPAVPVHDPARLGKPRGRARWGSRTSTTSTTYTWTLLSAGSASTGLRLKPVHGRRHDRLPEFARRRRLLRRRDRATT